MDVRHSAPMPELAADQHHSTMLPVRELNLRLHNHSKTWSTWIQAVLSHAPQLDYLSLTITECPLLPAMPQLQHLLLSARYRNEQQWRSLEQLTALRTLQLNTPIHFGIQEDVVVLPAAVQQLSLTGILPLAVQLSATAARQPVFHIDATAIEIRETAARWPMNVRSRIKSVGIRAEAYELEQAVNAPIWNGLPALLQLQISPPAHIGISLHFWQPVTSIS